MLTRLQEGAKERNAPAMASARVYAGLADKDKAFEWLEKAYQDRSLFLAMIRLEGLLEPLRSDPRWPDLLRRIGLPL